MFSRVLIMGLGLLGGSLSRAIKKRSPAGYVIACARNPENLRGAVDQHIVDEIQPLSGVRLRGVDLVVITAPVRASIGLLATVLDDPGLGEQALVIDVGSVKNPIVEAAGAHPRGDRFVGCHPLAGSEKTGFMHSREDLYAGAPVIITPHSRNSEADTARVGKFWETVGARPVIAPARLHDAAVARTSHLPHLLACALVDSVRDNSPPAGTNVSDFAGQGFRDVTRIALGSPEMWTDILLTNRANIVQAIDDMSRRLDALRSLLANGEADERELFAFFERVRRYRETIT
jgi:prephenate dehydrogenase